MQRFFSLFVNGNIIRLSRWPHHQRIFDPRVFKVSHYDSSGSSWQQTRSSAAARYDMTARVRRVTEEIPSSRRLWRSLEVLSDVRLSSTSYYSHHVTHDSLSAVASSPLPKAVACSWRHPIKRQVRILHTGVVWRLLVKPLAARCFCRTCFSLTKIYAKFYIYKFQCFVNICIATAYMYTFA